MTPFGPPRSVPLVLRLPMFRRTVHPAKRRYRPPRSGKLQPTSLGVRPPAEQMSSCQVDIFDLASLARGPVADPLLKLAHWAHPGVARILLQPNDARGVSMTARCRSFASSRWQVPRSKPPTLAPAVDSRERVCNVGANTKGGVPRRLTGGNPAKCAALAISATQILPSKCWRTACFVGFSRWHDLC